MPILQRERVMQFIESGIRCFDGAMGTMLMKAGLQPGTAPEMASEEAIISVHRQYIEAGAQFITTNTFGGTRIKLDKFRLGDKVIEINRRNANLARQAVSGADCFVAGDIGPTGEFLEPFGNFTTGQFTAAFEEQVKGLLEGGVDLFIIETMMALDEAVAAVKAIRNLSDYVVIACMTFNSTPRGYRTLGGTDVPTAAHELLDAGADVVGSNCNLTPEQMVGLMAEFNSATDAPLIAQPNAGNPRVVNGAIVYDLDANVEQQIQALIQNGANIVGGCCGTSPDYIRTVRHLIDESR